MLAKDIPGIAELGLAVAPINPMLEGGSSALLSIFAHDSLSTVTESACHHAQGKSTLD